MARVAHMRMATALFTAVKYTKIETALESDSPSQKVPALYT